MTKRANGGRPIDAVPASSEAATASTVKAGPLPNPDRASMRYLSPLRYPGAKSGIARCIAELIKANAKKPPFFLEPFAGGAATTLRLLADGIVSHAIIGDADPLVANFWITAATRPEWLVDRMIDEPVTLDRWDYWRAYEQKSPDDPELAVKCLFLNRTTFSGILHGRAGPIGGRKQESDYAIGCRFNKDALAERIRFVGDLYRSGRLVAAWRGEWQQTLKLFGEQFPEYAASGDVVVYLDPPYVDKADRLYTAEYAAFNHLQLAAQLLHHVPYRWVLSYDDHADIRALYQAKTVQPHSPGVRQWRVQKRLVELRYSASGRTGRGPKDELVITTLPKFPDDASFRAVEI
ncbi:DNA adenine methylase [Catellatospora sp. KI3]|uniref:DNA adenine methylase n=1 Tax=Catellatospora sp. KI3 TaxID=3041620 RepID=UPI00248260FE|nr:DNA adenine methylase [Catellatospora sp. KI3]MDI1463302.1 DNA adenine methylase [Catellatospora sp. KI3]